MSTLTMTFALAGACAVVPRIRLLALMIFVGIVAATMFAIVFLVGGPPAARTCPLDITV